MPEKPLPFPTPITQPFWDGLRERKVRIQYCPNCSRWVFYPRSHCPDCLSRNLEWREIAGTGKVYTYTVATRPTAPAFADEVPQKIAVVELDEGPHVTTTLVNVDQDDIKVGMRVKPYFDDVDGRGITLLRYQPA
jgi:uncharacterized OB-fold protein